MKWFRFYTEVLNDPKVQQLPDAMFKAWINILCIAAEREPRGTVPWEEKELAFILRVTARRAGEIKGSLEKCGLLDFDAETLSLHIHGWDKRQFESDDVTLRVNKHRRSRNVSETPPDTETEQTQNRTETETETDAPTEDENLLPFEPREPVIKELTPAYLVVLAGRFPYLDVPLQRQKYDDYNRIKGRVVKDHGAGLRNWLRQEEEWRIERLEKAQRNPVGAGTRGAGSDPGDIEAGWDAYARGE